MILAAGVWCCICVALNVLSEVCVRLRLPAHCKSVAGVNRLNSMHTGLYTLYMGHFFLGVRCYIVALDVPSISA